MQLTESIKYTTVLKVLRENTQLETLVKDSSLWKHGTDCISVSSAASFPLQSTAPLKWNRTKQTTTNNRQRESPLKVLCLCLSLLATAYIHVQTGIQTAQAAPEHEAAGMRTQTSDRDNAVTVGCVASRSAAAFASLTDTSSSEEDNSAHRGMLELATCEHFLTASQRYGVRGREIEVTCIWYKYCFIMPECSFTK